MELCHPHGWSWLLNEFSSHLHTVLSLYHTPKPQKSKAPAGSLLRLSEDETIMQQHGPIRSSRPYSVPDAVHRRVSKRKRGGGEDPFFSLSRGVFATLKALGNGRAMDRFNRINLSLLPHLPLVFTSKSNLGRSELYRRKTLSFPLTHTL